MVYVIDFTDEDIARILVEQFAHRFDECHKVSKCHIFEDGTTTMCSNCGWHFVKEYCLMDDATEKFYCLKCCLKRVIANQKKVDFYMTYPIDTYWVEAKKAREPILVDYGV